MSNLVIYASLLALGTFVSSISQVLLKQASQKNYSSRIKEYLNIRVIFAYFLFFTTTILCILAYKVVPLSFGPVIESSSYIYVTIFGIIIFKEKINKQKIMALIIIFIGILIYSMGL